MALEINLRREHADVRKLPVVALLGHLGRPEWVELLVVDGRSTFRKASNTHIVELENAAGGEADGPVHRLVDAKGLVVVSLALPQPLPAPPAVNQLDCNLPFNRLPEVEDVAPVGVGLIEADDILRLPVQLYEGAVDHVDGPEPARWVHQHPQQPARATQRQWILVEHERVHVLVLDQPISQHHAAPRAQVVVGHVEVGERARIIQVVCHVAAPRVPQPVVGQVHLLQALVGAHPLCQQRRALFPHPVAAEVHNLEGVVIGEHTPQGSR
mmetsp:Transcript_12330/g.39071  ORF Transcript_12330/g.39071 Transcript_12330/m.39071 type:complete len:269 (+) Transcript_12330:100-906(+)